MHGRRINRDASAPRRDRFAATKGTTMSHRSIGSDARSGHHIKASQPGVRALLRNAVRTSANSSTSTVKNATQHRLTLLGVSSIALVALLYARPGVDTQAASPAPAQLAVAAPAAAPLPRPAAAPLQVAVAQQAVAVPVAKPDSHRQQQAVTSWLSKRYRVADDAANMLVSTAYMTAKDVKLDPLLILAVMAIESGLNPFAESPVGAKGLMQVMANIHHAKFQAMGGPQTALNPVANIRVGSQILKEYVSRGGSVEAGLKSYVGAGAFDTDSGYGSRVLAELQKLKMVASGKNVPTFNRPAAPATAAKPLPHQDAVPAQLAPPVVAEEAIAGL
jgi:soluble lytic murein transglycosylase-like protein